MVVDASKAATSNQIIIAGCMYRIEMLAHRECIGVVLNCKVFDSYTKLNMTHPLGTCSSVTGYEYGRSIIIIMV